MLSVEAMSGEMRYGTIRLWLLIGATVLMTGVNLWLTEKLHDKDAIIREQADMLTDAQEELVDAVSAVESLNEATVAASQGLVCTPPGTL
jgi:hypothetical protein